MSALDLLTLTLADSRGYNDTMRKIAGFTLVEMMIALILLSIVMAIGIPSLGQMIRNNQMTTQGNNVLGALQLARSEALRRGQPVAACGSGDGVACDGQWGQGWIVYANPGAANTGPGGVNEVIRVEYGSADINAVGGLVRFTGQGERHENSATQITLSRATCGPEGRRVIFVRAGGRVNVESRSC